MIKMMILAPRRAGMTHAEFRRYVTEVHGPLVRSVPEVAADIRRYHYNFPITGLTDAAFGHPLASHLDIVTEAWFDSVEAQKQNMKLPRYLEVVRPDEHRFADGERAVVHYTHEVPVLGGERSLVKAFYFRRRRPGLSRIEFQERWLAQFGQTLAGNPGCGLALAGYVQNHVVGEAQHPDGADPKYFDVIDELFLTDVARLAVLGDHGPSLAAMRRLEEELLDLEATRAFVAETVVNIP
jgi:EthD domain